MLAMWLFFWGWAPTPPTPGSQIPPGSKFKFGGKLPFIFQGS